jgi:predicted RNA-binding protein YlqC (UPF0109 family)
MLEEALEHLVRGIVEHPDDLGKVIGRNGRTAKALRTVIGALGPDRSVRVDFLDVDER